MLVRLLNLFRSRDQHERDLNVELQTHLELHIRDNLAQGMTPDEARCQALLKHGGLEQTKEAIRDQQSLPSMESLLQDIRFTVRLNPFFPPLPPSSPPSTKISPFSTSSLCETCFAIRPTQRFSVILLSAFAGFAVLLACLGIYGLTNCAVSLRTREFWCPRSPRGTAHEHSWARLAPNCLAFHTRRDHWHRCFARYGQTHWLNAFRDPAHRPGNFCCCAGSPPCPGLPRLLPFGATRFQGGPRASPTL
jgi:hypothetical protein